MTRRARSRSAVVARDRVPARSATAVQRTSLPDQIATHLIREIVEGGLAPGTLLPTESELVREFSVGKSAVREAVRIVSTKGLVEVVQGSGMRVTPRQRWKLIDPELVSVFGGTVISMVDLMELRMGLEPTIAAHAAARASEEQTDQLQALVEESVARYTDIEGIVMRDIEFHNVLAEATGNPLYVIVLGTVAELQIELRRKVVKTKLGRDHGIHYHERIVEALRGHDQERAREQMTAHLNAVAEDLRLAIEDP
jgi:DNA-binding FadR family transcriptional regulator